MIHLPPTRPMLMKAGVVIVPFVSPIGDPTSLGVSTSAAASPQTITTTVDTPAKALIGIFSIGSNATTAQITAVSDNGGVNGAYNLLDTAAGAWVCQVAWVQNGASILPAGSVITATYAGVTNSRRCGAFFATFPAGQTITADTHAHAVTNLGTAQASALVSTGALAQAIELVMLFVGGGAATLTGFTPSAGFTPLVLAAPTGWLATAWQKTNSVASVGATSTWTSTATPYGADIVSFKGA